MIEDEFTLTCSYALVGYEGLETLRILGIEPSPIGPRVRWEAPGMPAERERIVSGAGYVTLGPPSGPMLLDMLSRTLAARWALGTPRCPATLRDTLQKRFPKLFAEEDPCVGPGWSWLFEAGAVAIRKRGVPRNFKTMQTKEKFGSARWYWCADESCEYTSNIIASLEHLSAFICEECGRPGRIRRGGWAKCSATSTPAARPPGNPIGDPVMRIIALAAVAASLAVPAAADETWLLPEAGIYCPAHGENVLPISIRRLTAWASTGSIAPPCGCPAGA